MKKIIILLGLLSFSLNSFGDIINISAAPSEIARISAAQTVLVQGVRTNIMAKIHSNPAAQRKLQRILSANARTRTSTGKNLSINVVIELNALVIPPTAQGVKKVWTWKSGLLGGACFTAIQGSKRKASVRATYAFLEDARLKQQSVVSDLSTTAMEGLKSSFCSREGFLVEVVAEKIANDIVAKIAAIPSSFYQ